MTFPIIISTLQTPPQLQEASSRINAGWNNNGLAVEIIPAKRPAKRFFPRLLNLISRPSLENRSASLEIASTKQPQQSDITQNSNLNLDEWIDIDGPEEPEEPDSKLSSNQDGALLPMATSDLSFKGFLKAQRSLEKFIHEYAAAFVASCKEKHFVWHGMSKDQKNYLESMPSKPLGALMPHVISMLPPPARRPEPSTDSSDRHTFDVSHFDTYRRDFRFEPGPRFMEIMRSLWTQIDIAKIPIYEKQREATRQAIAHGARPIKIQRLQNNRVPLLLRTSSLPASPAASTESTEQRASSVGARPDYEQWVDIPPSEELDALRAKSDIQIEDLNDAPTAPDEWEATRLMSMNSNPQPVSQLASSKPSVRAADLPIHDYQAAQLRLEKFIPRFTSEFLRDLRRIDAKKLLQRKLKKAEKMYLRDLTVKSPAMTMPNVLNMVPQSGEQTTAHCDAYRRDFDFEPSQYFLTIMHSIWGEIDRQKQYIYWGSPISIETGK